MEVAFSAAPRVSEGWFAVNGHGFNKDEICEYADTASVLLRSPEFCDALTKTTRLFAGK
jgi:hypothetical protein